MTLSGFWRCLAVASLCLPASAFAEMTPPPVAPPHVAVITNPDWVRKPTGEDLSRYYPAKAQQLGVEGQAVVRCAVEVTGHLRDCVVVRESPADMGFGDATIKLASTFLMRPRTRDGRPVDGAQVSIPVAWRLRDDPPPVPEARITLPVTWASRPTSDQIEAARPPVDNGAGAVIACGIDHEPSRLGRLIDCRVGLELPQGSHAGAAALTLAPYFLVAPAQARSLPPEARLALPITWPPRAPTEMSPVGGQ